MSPSTAGGVALETAAAYLLPLADHADQDGLRIAAVRKPSLLRGRLGQGAVDCAFGWLGVLRGRVCLSARRNQAAPLTTVYAMVGNRGHCLPTSCWETRCRRRRLGWCPAAPRSVRGKFGLAASPRSLRPRQHPRGPTENARRLGRRVRRSAPVLRSAPTLTDCPAGDPANQRAHCRLREEQRPTADVLGVANCGALTQFRNFYAVVRAPAVRALPPARACEGDVVRGDHAGRAHSSSSLLMRAMRVRVSDGARALSLN